MRIGILGGGQLGRMLALSAYPLGIECRFLDPAGDAPAGQVGELVIGAYDDPAALAAFCRGLDRVSFEFENVPTAALERIVMEGIAVFPPPLALQTGQDRMEEKSLFERAGVPAAACAQAWSRWELDSAVDRVGLPCVAKTRRLGYDGKGQAMLRTRADLNAAWSRLGPAAEKVGLVVEAFVPFEREVSMVGVRAHDGSKAFYALTENIHEHEPSAGGGILRVSRAPAGDAGLENAARVHIGRLMDSLAYVGVMAVEFFVVRDADGRRSLVANETAPRVHNSGHWTMDGARTGQFENHVRAVAGLPLGDTSMTCGAAAMVNLIGRAPATADLLGVPGARVHLYGKEPRPGRKIGHVNLSGPDAAAVETGVGAVMALIGR